MLSFEVFFKENFSKFHAFALHFIKDSHVSEDIVQETFIAVWEAKDTRYASPLMLQAYIYRTIRNKTLNYLKHLKIHEQYTQEYIREIESEHYLNQSVMEEELHHALYTAIQHLSPQCQRVILLHLEGKSNQEIAEEMSLSMPTVKSHKMVAYKELRTLLKDALPVILLFS